MKTILRVWELKSKKNLKSRRKRFLFQRRGLLEVHRNRQRNRMNSRLNQW